MNHNRDTRRCGYTLIELLVIMGVIVFMMGLTAAYLAIDSTQNSQRGADRMQGWLLIAKQWAKRDGRPTGLRLIAGGTNANHITRVQYIQQPDPVRGTSCTAKVAGSTGPVTLRGMPVPVEVGDYLEVNGVGAVYQITSVTAGTPAGTYAVLLTQDPNAAFDATADFRVHRSPQPVPNQEPLDLPDGAVVDISTTHSRDVPVRSGVGSPSIREIVFNPDGSVGGKGTVGRTIILWVKDSKATAITDGGPILLAIPSRTGFIAAHPIAPAPNYWSNAESGRASGL